MRKLLISILVSTFTMAIGTTPSFAQLNEEMLRLNNNLTLLSQALDDPFYRQRPVNILLSDFDITTGVASRGDDLAEQSVTQPLALLGGRNAQRMDVRLIFSLLTRKFGGKDNYDVERAQGEIIPHALLVRGVSVTLSNLPGLLEEAGYSEDSLDADGVLHVPLIIWRDASMVMRPGEQLVLSRETGVYVINLGLVELNGATIIGTEPQSPHNSDFRPFISTLENGVFRSSNSRFFNLGFGSTPKYAGVSILGSGASVRENSSLLQGNLFDNVKAVSVFSTNLIEIIGNKFADMRGNALNVSESLDATIFGNIFFGSSQTNSISIQNGSTRAQITGNVLLAGERAGIVVSHDVEDVTITNNIVWQRGGSGINLRLVTCANVANNVIIFNGQKGIEIRDGNGVVLSHNVIARNQSAGLWVSRQEPGARTYIYNNEFVENGSGISGATAAEMVMKGNDLTRQRPRLLDGDLTLQNRYIATNLTGAKEFILSSSGLLDEISQGPVETCAQYGHLSP